MTRSRILLLAALCALAALVWLLRRPPFVEAPLGDDARAAGSSRALEPRGTPSPEPERTPAVSPTHVDAEREPVAPLAPHGGLRLLDARTEEALPWYLVALAAHDGATEVRESDEHGLLTPSAAITAGALRLRLLDTQGQASADSSAQERQVVAYEPRAGVHGLSIEAGPTFALRFELPAGRSLEDFEAELFVDPPRYGERARQASAQTPVRPPRAGAGLPWVRFRALTFEGDPLWLRLSSRERAWSGGARVPGGYGACAQPVDIELQPRGVVRGRYVDPTGVQESAAALALFQTDPPQAEPRWEHTDRRGVFALTDLARGAYRLEVRDPAVRAAPLEFVLAGGELDLGELEWSPIAIAGSVRLRVFSQVTVPLDVELVRVEAPPQSPPWHSDDWERLPDGTFVSAFEWEEVYAGEYAVEVHAHDTTSWRLELGRLTPPVDGLELHLPPPAPALAFDVRDARTDAALTEYSVLVRQENAWDELEGSPAGLRSLVWDADGGVAVVSPGHQAWLVGPAGDAPASGSRAVVARLRPGWSRLYLARTRVGGRPVAGAQVWLDGRLAGTTDARGELWVHADEPPIELEVRHPTLLEVLPRHADDEGWVSWLILRP